MLRFKVLLLTAILTVSQWAVYSNTADAGPLLDWLRNACRRRPLLNRNVQPAPQFLSNTAYRVNGYGLQPGQCLTQCQQTCSRVVVNYVPCTSYRTNWERVPVTQYRPETRSDPCTGCTVTCMKPCTTYTYRMKRVPYTTYRPVYRTETYRVPVSYVSNDCNNGCTTCPTTVGSVAAPCNTCGIPSAPTYGTNAGLYQGQPTTTPSGTITTDGSIGTQSVLPPVDVSPAEITPSLNPQNSQRPIYEFDRPASVQGSSTRMQMQPRNTPTETWTRNSTPARFDDVDKLASVKIRRDWNYTPMKAAYASLQSESKVVEFKGQFEPVTPRATKNARKVNTGWETVDW